MSQRVSQIANQPLLTGTSTLPLNSNLGLERESRDQNMSRNDKKIVEGMRSRRNIQTSKNNKYHTIFLTKQADDYSFGWLSSKLQDGSQMRTQLLLQQNAQICDMVTGGFSNFLPSQIKSKQYRQQYPTQTQHLKMNPKELKLEHVFMKDCGIIDAIWKRIIQIATRELQTNQLMVVKLLKKIIKEKQLYKKLCVFKSDGKIMEPNPLEVMKFYTHSQPPLINDQSPYFIEILNKISSLYHTELDNCFTLMNQIVNSKHMKPIQHILLQKDIIKEAWRVLEISLSKKISRPMHKPNRSQSYIDPYYTLEKSIAEAKLHIPLLFANLLQSILKNDTTNNDTLQNRLYARCGQFPALLQFIDTTLSNFTSSPLFTVIQPARFERSMLRITMLIFPFTQFQEQRRTASNQWFREVRNAVLLTKSQGMEGLRVLMQLHSQKDRENHRRQTNRDPWKRLIENGLWNMTEVYWSRWLGIFLDIIPFSTIIRNPPLLSRVIYLCKAILKQQFIKFWQLSTSPSTSYLLKISIFIQNIIKEGDAVPSILPLLIKLLGTRANNYTHNVIEMMGGPQGIQIIIINKIWDNLNIDQQTHETKRKLEIQRLNSGAQMIEQEMKFLSRLIALNLQELPDLESTLFSSHRSTALGMRLIYLLCRCLYKLGIGDVYSIKCVRYIISAIDICWKEEENRKMIIYVLGAIQAKQNKTNTNAIKDIVLLCQSGLIGEEGRQGGKLKRVLSAHLQHVLLTINSVSQWFPLSSSTSLHPPYSSLNDHLSAGRDVQIYDFYQSQHPFRHVKWIYHLGLLLQSDQLLPTDYGSLKIITHKLKGSIPHSSQRESIQVLKQIINSGSTLLQLLRHIQPNIIQNWKFSNPPMSNPPPPTPPELLFSLCNHQLATTVPTHFAHNSKLSAWQITLKEKKAREKQRQDVLGCIAGSLSVVEAVMAHIYQQQYADINSATNYHSPQDDWQVITFVKNQMEGKLHMYEVKFIMKSSEGKQFQFDTSINFLHTIASYIDFQYRHSRGVEEYNCEYSGGSTDGLCPAIDPQQYPSAEQILVKHKLCELSQLSILHALPLRISKTISSTAIRILGLFLRVNKGKLLLDSLLHRNHPGQMYNSSISIRPARQNVLQFISALTAILTRQTSDRQKEVVLDWLATAICSSPMRGEITPLLHTMKGAFIDICKHITLDRVYILNKLILLIYNYNRSESYVNNHNSYLINHNSYVITQNKNYPQPQLQSQLNSFPPVAHLLQILLELDRPRFKPYCKDLLYHNLQMHQKGQCIIAYRSSLIMLIQLGMGTVNVSTEMARQEEETIIDKINFQWMVGEEYPQPLDNLALHSIQPHHAWGIHNGNITSLQSDGSILDDLLSSSAYPFGSTYLYEPIAACITISSENTTISSSRSLLLSILKYNTTVSIIRMQELLLQKWVTYVIHKWSPLTIIQRNNSNRNNLISSRNNLISNRNQISESNTINPRVNGDVQWKRMMAVARCVAEYILPRKKDNLASMVSHLAGEDKLQAGGDGWEAGIMCMIPEYQCDPCMLLLSIILKSLCSLPLSTLHPQICQQQLSTISQRLLYDLIAVPPQCSFRSFQLIFASLLAVMGNNKDRDPWYATSTDILQFLNNSGTTNTNTNDKSNVTGNLNTNYDGSCIYMKSTLINKMVMVEMTYLECILQQCNSHLVSRLIHHNPCRQQFILSIIPAIASLLECCQSQYDLPTIASIGILQCITSCFNLDALLPSSPTNPLIMANSFQDTIGIISMVITSSTVSNSIITSTSITTTTTISQPHVRVFALQAMIAADANYYTLTDMEGMRVVRSEWEEFMRRGRIDIDSLVEMRMWLSWLNLLAKDINWGNSAYLPTLQYVFLSIVKLFPFSPTPSLIPPTTPFQLQLQSKIISQPNPFPLLQRQSKSNALQMIGWLRMHQVIKEYTTLIGISVINSRDIAELVDKTLSTLEEEIWDNIQSVIGMFLEFYEEMMRVPMGVIEEALRINKQLSTSPASLVESLLPALFPLYSMEEWMEDVGMGIGIIGAVVGTIVDQWRKMDWKSRSQQLNAQKRKEMMRKWMHIAKKWSTITKLDTLKEIHSQIQYKSIQEDRPYF